MKNRRVVITGAGALTPLGSTVPELWDSLTRGACGIDLITKFDTSDYKVKLAAEIRNFDPHNYFDSPTDIRRTDLYTQYAAAAAGEAVEDSGILGKIAPGRFGVYVGSGIGGVSTFIAETLKLQERGPSRVSPLFVPMMIANMAAGMISIRYGAMGPTLPAVTACATSSTTIGEAYRAIKHGYADAIVAGGAEAAINGLAVAGFSNSKALYEGEDKDAASLPFDLRRSGFVMGEGAAAVILEEYAHALSRGAKIYAEICGYGNTADAYHMTAPHPEALGAAAAVRLAAAEAGIDGSERVYVNAHGTGTRLNDQAETLAYKKAFRENAGRLHISSTKSMTGHMLGAAGAVEAIAAALALRDGIVPPTINLETPDPECDLDYTPLNAVKTELDCAFSSSFGFGGHNSVLAFRKLKEA